jgi:hypothetical protein
MIDPVITTPYTILILFLIDIAIVAFIIYNVYYLSGCDCFTQNGDATILSNLNYIYYVEIIIFVTYIFNFFELWRLTQVSMGEIIMVKSIKATLMFFLTVMAIAYLFLYYYLTNISDKVGYSCPCFHVEVKYVIYFQMIFFSVSYFLLLHQIFIQWLKSRNYI